MLLKTLLKNIYYALYYVENTDNYCLWCTLNIKKKMLVIFVRNVNVKFLELIGKLGILTNSSNPWKMTEISVYNLKT